MKRISRLWRSGVTPTFIGMSILLAACGGATKTETIIANNNVPVAKIAPLDVLAPNMAANLTGTDSFDADNDALTFVWSLSQKPAGSNAVIADSNANDTSLALDVAGDYEVTLVANDGKTNSQPTKLPIKVRDPITNVKPVANAGSSMVLTKGEVVGLDGSRSADAESAALQYTWSFVSVPAGSQAQLVNAHTVTASFTPDVAGEYKVGLVVNDGMIDSAADVAVIIAKDPVAAPAPVPNAVPIADAGENQVLKLGYTGYLDGAGSHDTDHNPLKFTWTVIDSPAGSNPNLSDATLIRPSIRPDIGGTYKFQLVVNDGLVDSIADTVTVMTTDGRSEIEPNNDSAHAQKIIEIGLNSPIAAKINASTDIDYYQIPVVKDQTYIIELFSVSNAFRDAVGTKCGISSNGLFAKLFDQANIITSSQCSPNGAGDVHTYIEFKAANTGFYLLQIGSNSTAVGDYNLRVLLSLESDKAMWDSATMEPNNRPYIAYKLDLGHTHAKVAALEARSSAYTTSRADVDWYRITATAGQTYVVEVFDVALGLAVTSGSDCTTDRNGNGGLIPYAGLALRAFDTDVIELKRQCNPVGAGNVNNTLQFTATTAGVYYIQVESNAKNSGDTGSYSIRVLPKHDDPAATADPASFEPNNTLVNAYSIGLGKDNALTTALAPRPEGLSTNRADIDFYRIAATAGQTYVVEVFDAGLGVALTSGYDCTTDRNGNGGLIPYAGLSLRAFGPDAVELKRQCNPVGAGNVHNILQFTATMSGAYYIQVASNALNSADKGSYSIRVLPKYDDPAATADSASFEPNNTFVNAYPIGVGPDKALTSALETRSDGYSTNRADVDWYRVSATAGQVYAVELFDTGLGLALTSGYDCTTDRNGNGGLIPYKGVFLRVLGTDAVELKRQCNPLGSGNVHNSLTFTAPSTGVYYVQVASNALSSFDRGVYSIRVIAK